MPRDRRRRRRRAGGRGRRARRRSRRRAGAAAGAAPAASALAARRRGPATPRRACGARGGAGDAAPSERDMTPGARHARRAGALAARARGRAGRAARARAGGDARWSYPLRARTRATRPTRRPTRAARRAPCRGGEPRRGPGADDEGAGVDVGGAALLLVRRASPRASSFVALACDLAGDQRSARVARLVALGALVPVAAAADHWTSGGPSASYNMLRIFKPRSPMSMGAWCLIGVRRRSARRRSAPTCSAGRRGARALGAANAVVGGYLGSYTGVLLASTAVPVWARSRLFLGPIFVATGDGDRRRRDAAGARRHRRCRPATRRARRSAASRPARWPPSWCSRRSTSTGSGGSADALEEGAPGRWFTRREVARPRRADAAPRAARRGGSRRTTSPARCYLAAGAVLPLRLGRGRPRVGARRRGRRAHGARRARRPSPSRMASPAGDVSTDVRVAPEAMSFKDPKAITAAGVETGADEGARCPGTSRSSPSFLAGAYIAFAGLLAITVSSGMDPKLWGTLPTLFTGAVFALGLILVVIAGSELLTGNMALVPLAAQGPRRRSGRSPRNFVLVMIGNLLGSLFVAYFLAVKTGVRHRRAAARAAGGDRHGQGRRRRPTGRSSCARSAATGWSASPSGWRWPPRTSAARSWRSSSRSWPSSRWASTTSWPTCSSCRRRSSPTCRASPGATRCTTGCSPSSGNLVGAAIFVAAAYWYLYARGEPAQTESVRETALAESARDGQATRASDRWRSGTARVTMARSPSAPRNVAVSNLAYAHPGGDLLFSDVSFRSPPGDHVGAGRRQRRRQEHAAARPRRRAAGRRGRRRGRRPRRLHAAGRRRRRRRAHRPRAAARARARARCAPPGERMLAAERALAAGDDDAGMRPRRRRSASGPSLGGYELEGQWDAACRRIVRARVRRARRPPGGRRCRAASASGSCSTCCSPPTPTSCCSTSPTTSSTSRPSARSSAQIAALDARRSC